MITSLNHITLAVKDLEKSFLFYKEFMGFKALLKWPKGAYFEVGDLWFCLSLDPEASPSQGYTHMAFSVSQEDFPATVDRLQKAAVKSWKDNKSEGDSFYFLDPDRHKLELHVGDKASRLKHYRANPLEGMVFY